MLDFLVAGFPALLVVLTLVEAIKRLFKLEGDAAIPIALGVGVLIAVAGELAEIWPVFGQWWQTALVGILLGLAACGLFDAGQAIKAKVKP